MEHPDDEVLTQFALDDPLAVDAATLVHISDCDRCTDDIQEIQRVVDGALAAGGRPDLRTLVPPPPSVWEQLVAEIGEPGRPHDADEPADAGGATTTPASTVSLAADRDDGWLFEQPGEIALESSDGDAGDRTSGGDRRTLWQVAVAAAVGLIIGAGTAWLVAGDDDEPVATSPAPADAPTAPLTGVDGNVTSGEIALVEREGHAPEITITLATLDRSRGFLEAWLVNADSGGLVALGVFDGVRGTFAVPPALNLSKYDQVEVSREPFDGDPTHSPATLARGPVPQP
jgi:hypothetical protein